ncbi:MAG: glycosyltransferase family 39 protein [Patescibacteria group bacterium]|nr:glycosyltransferase family 39 protein [Patescibacteria group bacterium]MDE1988287.1 glycosyltransferase family 39 protein [Patescibacteria group bacterium]MDE2218063.1 glycosyltransferase family 39 protein [Patescibacteria group bacterium]
MKIENKRHILLLSAVMAIFIILRVFGLSMPYHQDERKNVSSSSSISDAGAFFAHPPLMQMIFVSGNFIFGSDNMRVIPLLFSVASVILLYFTVRNRLGNKTALWSVAIFSICFYDILGSLSPDVDGAILPFFFILAAYAYDKLMSSGGLSARWKWLSLLVAALLIGFLIKLSFILVVGTILIDYVWSRGKKIDKKEILTVAEGIFGFGVLYIALIYGIKAAYPAFDISIMMGHAKQFAAEGRNWTQIIVQGLKAMYYLSPLMIIPLFFTNKDIFKKTRVFFTYFILGFIFYFILFDFSRGALDKYLMFSIAPLSVICGAILSDIFIRLDSVNKKQMIKFAVFGVVLSSALLALNFINHSTPSLYPKTEWFGKVVHLRWNILNPFNGGSGPLGFYVSFLFIAISFIVSVALGIIGLVKKEWKMGISVILIILGTSYNLVFAEEFLFGKINGSAPKVLREAVSFIGNSPQIKNILTYNDIGSYELSKIKKYAGRIYATPEFEDGYRKKFEEHIANGGNFLVVDIPHINPKSFYGEFFAKCKTEFEARDKKIEAKVYSCKDDLAK